ncbi:MAG: Arabinose metabolism transcriptional repressor [bacterium]|nr:Arabinose metabolism transcriptional repressor [bacterium]
MGNSAGTLMSLDFAELASRPISKESPVPLYAQVQEILSNFILEKALSEGAEFPTEAQLCEIFKVSRITTKRALDELVREGLIRRVKGVGNFVSAPEEELAPKLKNYGLIAEGSFDLFANNFYSKVFQGIYESVNLEGGSLIFALSDRSVSNGASLPVLLQARSISGLIVLGCLEEGLLLSLKELRVPIVLVDDNRSGFNRVVTDNAQGTETAIRYLVKKGHAKIGLVTSDLTTSFRERTQGYARAMKHHGLSSRPEWIRIVERTEDPHIHQVFGDLLRLPEGERPSAVFAVNDHFALNGVRAAAALGLRVPEDVSIMGFDDTPFAKAATPNLTTIRVQNFRMGELAVAALHRLMETRRSEIECIVMPTELVERDSVGPPREA